VLRERKRWSFTPAELAAAVAIAGVLSALLLPAFAVARALSGKPRVGLDDIHVSIPNP